MDYGYRFKKRNNENQIRLMVIANIISKDQIETLSHLKVEYREIPDINFTSPTKSLDVDVNKIDYSAEINPLHESYNKLVYDRGVDARYFGFSGKRAIAAWLYARNVGATQEEVNTFMQELTNQKGFYNMLDQSDKWGHAVAIWDDPARGKVFKLIYNLKHKAKQKVETSNELG